jgi:hypothetical protein
MPVSEGHSIASLTAKKDTMPKTVLRGKKKEGQEPKPISSTSILKKIRYTKGAKLKGAE